MSGFAWWYQYKMGRRSAAFWGPTGVVLVQYAPEVDFVPLFPQKNSQNQDSSVPTLAIDGVEWWAGEPINITNSRGLVHVRHALVDDLSFDWAAPTTSRPKRWEFLLRFRDRDQHVTVAIDTESGQLFYVEGARIAQFIPHIGAAMRQKRDDWQKMVPRSPAPALHK